MAKRKKPFPLIPTLLALIIAAVGGLWVAHYFSDRAGKVVAEVVGT